MPARPPEDEAGRQIRTAEEEVRRLAEQAVRALAARDAAEEELRRARQAFDEAAAKLREAVDRNAAQGPRQGAPADDAGAPPARNPDLP
jgi:predicted  nucleic acid-binding Zn-ribbon protein